MTSTLGTTTTSIWKKAVESYKLRQRFSVKAGETVQIAQLVKLTVAGEVEPLDDGDDYRLAVGISLQAGVGNNGDEVTVALKGFTIINGAAETASLNAGPVSYSGYNSVSGKHEFDDDTVTDAICCGWALDAGTEAGDEIRVLIKGA